MDILLINTNPVVSRIIALCSKDLDANITIKDSLQEDDLNSFDTKAPTGHTEIQSPHCSHLLILISIVDLYPPGFIYNAAVPITSLQVWTHFSHIIQRDGSYPKIHHFFCFLY